MEGRYTAISLKNFITSLKMGLDKRIDQFYEDHKDDTIPKSKEDWTKKYFEWTNEQRTQLQRDRLLTRDTSFDAGS